MKALVTGGVRSGKSQHAEGLLSEAGAVTYIAAGPTYDDADWAARVLAHQVRRPEHWSTVETVDVPGALRQAKGAVLIDCLGTWLSALIDEAQLWEAPSGEINQHVARPASALVAAIASHADAVVVVTNEVGLGVVPEHRSARLFRDLLGTLNQQVGQACDQVHLVVAGRVLVL
ncbi:MAG: bifunctional adenosylcobinamide kinase/adenosylcobinamide-phosphate guanylyltransferase [Nocardioidaceae bacterium]|nr:bifunctional adenosylcobinamide kinase/adenosylcobinamide-phosphate guanylyltransferase [Nocardioidaceae bacterium]